MYGMLKPREFTPPRPREVEVTYFLFESGAPVAHSLQPDPPRLTGNRFWFL